MTLRQAKNAWEKKYPDSGVTFQTIRNWAKKYGFGRKKNFLPRSPWIIDDKKFNEFLNDPKSFLNGKGNKDENN